MLFVELGREVSPRCIKNRHFKAVITGIINNKFVVVLKQDKTSEVVRLKDVVLNEPVYDLEELKEGHEFFRIEKKEKKSSDFDRFKAELENRIVEELIKAKGIKN